MEKGILWVTFAGHIKLLYLSSGKRRSVMIMALEPIKAH